MAYNIQFLFYFNAEIKCRTIPIIPIVHKLHRVHAIIIISTSDVMLGFYKNEEGSGLEKYYLMI